MTTPKTPKPTYSQIIVNHMLAGQTISTMEAFGQYGITCLAQRVSDLRAAGLPIKSTMVKENGKHFSRYWINKPNNNTANEVTK